MRFLCMLLACLVIAPAWADDAPKPIREKQILPYLDQLTDWQRALSGLDLGDANARETLLREVLKKNARKVMQNGFDFARAEVVALGLDNAAPADGETNDRAARLKKRALETDQRVAAIQASQAKNAQALRKAPRRQRAPLLAEQERLAGELKLAQAEKDLLKTISGIFAGSAEEGGLSGKITALSRAVLDEPAASATAPATGKTGNGEDAAAKDANDHGGIFSLTGDLFTLARKRQAVDAMASQTATVKASTTDLIASLRSSLQEALKQGAALTAAQVAPKDMPAHRAELDALITRYKQLATAVVPLGQASFMLDASLRNLEEWGDLANQEWKRAFHQLMIRLGILGLCILVPVIISDAMRRATRRYVQDPKRKSQLRILRRVVFGLILALVVILNFVTEFSSLATFAGFLTAGLAVALQTVLLSLVAHFFFFGRFGVRSGDRVTVSGVTGDVIQVGMLRIYLMELKGNETDMRATGKIVAFPNSVLFGSAAFIKQVPGTSYGWKELLFAFGPGIDYKRASERIMQAVDAVYGEYKEAIELQHMALEQSTRLSVKLPAPKSEMRFGESGMTCAVHYPIVLKRAGEIYERITQALMEAFAQEKDMQLILSSPLRIQAKESGEKGA